MILKFRIQKVITQYGRASKHSPILHDAVHEAHHTRKNFNTKSLDKPRNFLYENSDETSVEMSRSNGLRGCVVRLEVSKLKIKHSPQDRVSVLGTARRIYREGAQPSNSAGTTTQVATEVLQRFPLLRVFLKEIEIQVSCKELAIKRTR